MKRIFRWMLISFGTLVVLLVIASVVAWQYKPELTAAIHEKIKENINGEFNIDNISVSILDDFPQVSVTLDGIYLRGLRYEVYKKDFFRAEKVLVNVHLWKLFRKEIDVQSIRIKNAEIFVFRAKSGYSNLDIFKKDTVVTGKEVSGSSNTALLSIHKVFFNNVQVSYQDSLKEKSFGVRFVEGRNDAELTDSSRQFHYTGTLEFDRLELNARKGSYLLGSKTRADLNGEFVTASHSLKIFPSELLFKKSTVGLSGAFHFVPDGRFKLDIISDNLDYNEGRSLIPKALGDKLANYNIDVPFSLKVHINGFLKPGDDPRVDVGFETKDALITVDKREASHAFVKGLFTNHVDSTKEFNDPNSKIEITKFAGDVYGFPVKAYARFKDLQDPFLDLNLTVDADAKKLQEELDSAMLRTLKGSVITNILYSGKLNDLADPSKRMATGKFSGTAEIKDLQLLWVPRKVMLSKVNGNVSFTRQMFEVRSFSFLINKSAVNLTGKVDGFVNLFNNTDGRVFVRLNVASPDLNTTSLFPESEKPARPASRVKGNKALSDMMDRLYRRLEFDLSLSVRSFQHRNFKATDISGNVALRNNQLQANPMKMKIAGGEVDVKFGLSDLNKNLNPLWVQASVHRADIREFFYAFNNFKQRTIDSQNLSGKINANVGLTAVLDDDFNVLMPSVVGNVDLTVKDGKLSNFTPLEKLSNFLFKRRDFSDVDFAEIKSTFDLKGTELTISRMEVESSVMSMFIEGRYSLADSTDLIIQLPLSNLRRRDKSYKPVNVGTDTKVGPSVFLRARPDEKGVMGIAYDPFHKFRKKK